MTPYFRTEWAKRGGSSGAIATTIPRFERRSVEKVAIAGRTVAKIQAREKREKAIAENKARTLGDRDLRSSVDGKYPENRLLTGGFSGTRIPRA